MNEIEKLIEQLHFGCPFKPNTIGIKDAEKAEAIMELAANTLTSSQQEVERLKDQLHYVNLQPCPERKELESELERVRGELENTKILLKAEQDYQEFESSLRERVEKAETERDKYKYTLQFIADDSETQTSGSFGMKRLAGYAIETLSGSDWLDEFAKDERIADLEAQNAQLKEENKLIKATHKAINASHNLQGAIKQARTEAAREIITIAEQCRFALCPAETIIYRIKDKFGSKEGV